MAEQFIWLETYAINPPFIALLKGELPTVAFRTLLNSFVVDEENHSAAVWQLLRQARPDLYPTNQFFFFKPPAKIERLVKWPARYPRLLSRWTLFVGAFEEQTITLSRLYKEPDAVVDALFIKVFTLHAQDEARHCKLGSLMADWLISPQKGLARWMNGKFLEQLFVVYHDTHWGCATPVRQLVNDFPALVEQCERMIEATQTARSGHHILRLMDRSVTPLTARNAERYGMLDRAIRRVAETQAH